MGYRSFRVAGIDVLLHKPPRAQGALPAPTVGAVNPEALSTAPVQAAAGSGSHAAEAGSADALRRRVNAIEWYHTIDLAHGVATPGWFDLRATVGRYPIPARLDGLRVLDVATFDGFWAFELEKRGAAEVLALDIDSFAEVDMSPRLRRSKDPAYLSRKLGDGFRLAHEVLGSKVQRVVCNVYDLSPARLGQFDLVFISDVLLHLMNPMKALANVASVTKPGGMALINDVFNPRLPGKLMAYESGLNHNTWWDMSFGALEQMVVDAGFAEVKLHDRFELGYRAEAPVLWKASFVAKA
jgi:tRNA (mo5U34)-methyltransferase